MLFWDNKGLLILLIKVRFSAHTNTNTHSNVLQRFHRQRNHFIVFVLLFVVTNLLGWLVFLQPIHWFSSENKCLQHQKIYIMIVETMIVWKRPVADQWCVCVWITDPLSQRSRQLHSQIISYWFLFRHGVKSIGKDERGNLYIHFIVILKSFCWMLCYAYVHILIIQIHQ